MNIEDISLLRLLAIYLLLLLPLTIILWHRIPIFGDTVIAVVRMALQLLFVGLYLQVVFRLGSAWINLLWLFVMIGVADVSVLRSCGLRVGRFVGPLFVALLVGTFIPLCFFVGPVLERAGIEDAQYVIPIGGMILGNCLRATIIGMKTFYYSVRDREKVFLGALASGARLREATEPFLRDALRDSLAPTVATIATIGLVALPGMMTGVILGGISPMTAIKYQMAIMVSILCATAVTVMLAIRFTMKSSFTAYGILDLEVFRE